MVLTFLGLLATTQILGESCNTRRGSISSSVRTDKHLNTPLMDYKQYCDTDTNKMQWETIRNT